MATSLTSGVEGYTAKQKGVNERRISLVAAPRAKDALRLAVSKVTNRLY
jgi:hypothetical protein